MDAAPDKEEKGRHVLIKSKITYFALWLVPFLISAFSDRMYLTASGRFMHFIGINSTATAAVLAVLAVVIFTKSLRHKPLNMILWVLIGLDLLVMGISTIDDTRNYYPGYVDDAIAGEEGVLYHAMFWSPLFALFKYTPGLNVLLWTEKIFSKYMMQAFAPVTLGLFIFGQNYFGQNLFMSAEYKEKTKINFKNYWKPLTALGVFAVFVMFMMYRQSPWQTKRNDEIAELESLAKFYELGYSIVPDSEDTKRAWEMIKNGNIDDALRLLETAGADGDSTASAVLAQIYEDGAIAPHAHMLYKRGAERGNLAALSGFARTYRGKQNATLLKFAAECGDRHNLNMQILGKYYMQGVYVKADYPKSAHYYKIAAEEGSLEGAWQTAGFLYRGYMSERDLDGAERWANETKQMRGDHENFYHEQAGLLLERITRAKGR